jgi:hypothetical protein
MNGKSKKLLQFVAFFDNLPMLNIRFRAGASLLFGSANMMLLLTALAPQH